MATGEKLGGGYLSLSADKQQLISDLGAAKGFIGGWLNSVQGILGSVGLGLSAAAIWGSLQEAEDAALQADRAFKRLEGVVNATGEAAGFTAEELSQMATVLQDEIGYSDESLEDAMSTMLTFKKVTGETFKEAIGLGADMAEVFGGGEGGLRSSAMQLGKALEDPVKGMNALRRSGITFTEAEQKKIKALVASNQLLKAQGMILSAVRGQVGGAARNAASGPEGELRKARLRLDDMKEGLGKEVLPLQMLLVRGQMLWTQALTETLRVANQIAPVINSWLNPLEGFSGKLLFATATAFSLARAFPAITAAARAAYAAIQMMTISTGWGIVLVAIGLVVAAVWQLVEVGLKSQEFARGWPAIAEKFGAAWIGAMEVVNALWQAFAGVANSILAALGINTMTIADSIGGFLLQVLDFLAEVALRTAAVAMAIVEHGDLAWDAFAGYAEYGLRRAGDYVTGFFSMFVRTAANAISAVINMFEEVPNVIAEIFNGGSVTNAVSAALGRVADKFHNDFQKDLAKSLTESPETAKAKKSADDAFRRLTMEAAKNYMDFMRKAKPATGEEKKKRGGGMPTPDAPIPKFKSGLYGFEDYSKMIQDAMLKSEDPTEKLVGLTEAGNLIQNKQLEELKKIEKKQVSLAVAEE